MVTGSKCAWLIAALLFAGLCMSAPSGCSDNEIKAIDRVSQTGGGAGTGIDASAGKAGSGGVSGTGGSEAGGSEAGGGDADSSIGGSSGKDGSAGSSGAGGATDSGADGDSSTVAQDCAAQCSADYCQGQTEGVDCSTCLISVCVQAGARVATAFDAPDYQACAAGCSDATCVNACCNQYPQGCAAVGLEHLCACGYPATNCKAACVDACTGTLSASCETCVRNTPCGVSLYDYDFTQDTSGHACFEGCGGDPTCVAMCCGLHLEACAAYQVAATCACGL